MNGANQRVNGSVKEINRAPTIQKQGEVAHNANESGLFKGFAVKASAELIRAFIRRIICSYAKRPRRWGPTGPGSRRRPKSSYQRENNDGFDFERQS